MMKQIRYKSKGGEMFIGQEMPFLFSNLEGAGMSAEVFSTKGIYQDGESYQGSLINGREMTLTIIGNGGDHAFMVNRIYSTFIPKSEGTFFYNCGDIKRKANCYVKSIDVVDLHSHIKAMIVFSCPDAFFYDIDEIVSSMATWERKFYFPVPYGISPVIHGMYNNQSVKNIENAGGVEVYPQIEIIANSDVTNPSVINVYTREYMKVLTTLKRGDIIIIDTKRKTIYKNGLNIFSSRQRGSKFFPLNIGDNIIQFDADGGKENLEVKFYYNNAYLGV